MEFDKYRNELKKGKMKVSKVEPNKDNKLFVCKNWISQKKKIKRIFYLIVIFISFLLIWRFFTYISIVIFSLGIKTQGYLLWWRCQSYLFFKQKLKSIHFIKFGIYSGWDHVILDLYLNRKKKADLIALWKRKTSIFGFQFLRISSYEQVIIKD